MALGRGQPGVEAPFQLPAGPLLGWVGELRLFWQGPESRTRTSGGGFRDAHFLPLSGTPTTKGVASRGSELPGTKDV